MRGFPDPDVRTVLGRVGRGLEKKKENYTSTRTFINSFKGSNSFLSSDYDFDFQSYCDNAPQPDTFHL